MLAVGFSAGQVGLHEVPVPRPRGGEALIRVIAAGLNGADVLQRDGQYPPPEGATETPGLEVAGVIEDLGPEVRDFSLGDKVMALVQAGGQAQFVVAHERTLIPLPDTMDWQSAGGFMEAFATAFDALFLQARLGVGERVLITGANGGVGTAAIQLASLTGAHVVAAARATGTHDRLRDLGADVTIHPDEIEEYGPYDVQLELVGAPNIRSNLRSLALHGRLHVIGVGGGFRADVNLLSLMTARSTMTGSTIRARSFEDRIGLIQELDRRLSWLLAIRRIRVPVERVFSFDDAAEAYHFFERSAKVGKIILSVDPNVDLCR